MDVDTSKLGNEKVHKVQCVLVDFRAILCRTDRASCKARKRCDESKELVGRFRL